ncbi:HNH endonuclease signature motif containing protein [Microbacterium indicum]|uniref:HNH endonuclease signature motif containing protein n=1 Tax=Microbacterium indicum TaxID=358100 RepID=UPI0004286EC2|nr:HNH endonuclease signature motif containing protein [Microbacterium indicum]
MTDTAPDATSWDMTPDERRRADEALAALRVAQEMRAGADSLAASAQAVLDAISAAQAGRMPGRGDHQDLPYRSMADEVASATHVSRTVASNRLREASTLTRQYPATQQALRAGLIADEHVRAIISEGARLAHDDTARAAYEERILEFAADSTPQQTRRAAKVIADRLSPRDFDEAHAVARARRRVTVRDLDDGMSELTVVGDAAVIHGILDRLTTMGRKVASAHRIEHQRERAAATGFPKDPNRRSLDQIRADLLADIMLTGQPNAHQLHTPGDTALDEIRATVQVVIPVDRLVGTGAGTGPGAGQPLSASDQPIATATARRLAARAPTWDRIFVRPDGQVVATDGYRPTRDQRRFLLARDGTCRFPGCTAAARSCDIDHTHDHALGGETTLDNLGCLCEAHHMVKHNTPWKVKQVGDGVYEWTSPLGSKRVTRPGGAVRFRDLAEEPAPF